MRAVNETVKFLKLTQKKASDKKRSSSEIDKLDRELKAAERKYYQDKTKHDQDSLEIEKQKLANDNTRIGIEKTRLAIDKQLLVNDNTRIEIEETRLEIDVDRLKLSKQERQDRLEISRLHRELLKEIQIEESKVKLQGKQIDWDNTRDHWFSKISREETQFILTKYNHRLLILTSPLEVDPYFDNAQNFQQWSFKQEMRKVDKFLSHYYPNHLTECPVQFYCDYFTETISKIDVNRLHDLLSSVATYVLYSDISDDTVTFWVAHWQTEQSEATHFQPFEWNWRETKDKLVAQGETDAAAILVVKQTIIEIHRLLTAYLADSYYLTIDPFYEPQLFEIFKQEEQPALQPFVESLREFQVEQRTAYYQELARIEAEYSRQELAQQQERERQQELARQQDELQGKLFRFTVPSVDDTGKIIKQTTHKARCLTIDIGNGVSLEMVYIPGNLSFWMQGVFLCSMGDFHMGKYAITQAQYQAIMGTNPVEYVEYKGANRPVTNVSGNDAVEFCKKLSQRTDKEFSLPCEIQWEYACKAGTTTPFYFGETITTDLVNYDGNYNYGNAPKGQNRNQTTNVGSFPPNAFGLYDMHGNVRDWCLDTLQKDHGVGLKNGKAYDNNYIQRGGSFAEHAQNSRSEFRGWIPDDDERRYYQGFRVVISPSSAVPILYGYRGSESDKVQYVKFHK
ncbi:MAG: formylglycine-generating enzyme family protein [Pseudanabaena sp. ELA645]